MLCKGFMGLFTARAGGAKAGTVHPRPTISYLQKALIFVQKRRQEGAAGAWGQHEPAGGVSARDDAHQGQGRQLGPQPHSQCLAGVQLPALPGPRGRGAAGTGRCASQSVTLKAHGSLHREGVWAVPSWHGAGQPPSSESRLSGNAIRLPSCTAAGRGAGPSAVPLRRATCP